MTISEYDRHLDKCSKNRRSSSRVKALAQAQKKRIHKIACDKLRLMMPSEAINVPVDHGRFEYIMAGETTGGINSLTACTIPSHSFTIAIYTLTYCSIKRSATSFSGQSTGDQFTECDESQYFSVLQRNSIQRGDKLGVDSGSRKSGPIGGKPNYRLFPFDLFFPICAL